MFGSSLRLDNICDRVALRAYRWCDIFCSAASSVVGVRLLSAATAQLEPAGQAVCDSPAVPAVGYRRPPDQGASEVHKRRALAARQ